jgi:hypothetical protein
MPKAEAASNNAIVRNCAYASARFFRGPLGHVVLDPPKALRASRIFFRPSVTPAFRANFSASAWVSVAPFRLDFVVQNRHQVRRSVLGDFGSMGSAGNSRRTSG